MCLFGAERCLWDQAGKRNSSNTTGSKLSQNNITEDHVAPIKMTASSAEVERETSLLYIPVQWPCEFRKFKGFRGSSFSRSLRTTEFPRESFLLRIEAFLSQPTSVQRTSDSLGSLWVQGLFCVDRVFRPVSLSGLPALKVSSGGQI